MPKPNKTNMKQLTSLLLIAIIAFSCKSEKTDLKSDLELANLKGKVWKIERNIHNANAGSACPAAEKVMCNQSIFVYNERGNLIESSDIDDRGNIALNCKYVYDRHDVCNEIQKYTGEKLVGKEVNILIENKLTEIKSFNEYGVNDKIYKYEYSGGLLAEEKTLNSSGEVESSVHNEYINGQLELQTKKDANGDTTSVVKYKRNAQNDIIEYTITVPKGNMEYRFTFEYEYDDEGNWTKQTQFYNGGIETITLRNITYFNT